MKVLITGDQGFIGSHFAAHLSGHDITRVDIAGSPAIDARDFFRKDDTNFDLVIHCAALVGGRRTIEGSPLSIAVDLSIDSEMFGWAMRTRPGRVVYFSSSAAYPTDLQNKSLRWHLKEMNIDLTGKRLGNPDLTYGWVKLTGEMLAQHAIADGLKVMVVRPFSGYGTDQALDYPFPSMIDRAVRRADPFDVWGDGEQVRDFIHVDDIVAGVMAAYWGGVDGPFNLGWGRPTSMNELAWMACSEARYCPRVRHLSAEPVGVQFRVAETSFMNTFYVPSISLEEGIARAFRYQSIHQVEVAA
jgi:nucleoside-diphosphate-sugar epimerase